MKIPKEFLATTRGRLWAYYDMVFVDHGFLRVLWTNFHKVSGRLFRCNQPWPQYVRRKIRSKGLKTLINLRGPNESGWYWLEREAAEKAGIAFEDFRAKSRDVPSKEMIRDAIDLFRRIEYPAMMHCKSGADRAGLMAVLYLHVIEGEPIESAMEQLSVRYLHMKHSKTGLIDHFFEAYRRHNERAPMPFLEWVEQVYDPDTLRDSFRPRWLASVIVDKILRRE